VQEVMTFADLRKVYKLPDWTTLNDYFEIGKLEESSSALQQILRTIMERLETHIKFLEDILQPDSLHSYQEANSLSEKEKKQVSELFQLLMYQYRACLESELSGPRAQAQRINEITTEWPGLRKELLGIIQKVKKSWNNKQISTSSEGYFG